MSIRGQLRTISVRRRRYDAGYRRWIYVSSTLNVSAQTGRNSNIDCYLIHCRKSRLGLKKVLHLKPRSPEPGLYFYSSSYRETTFYIRRTSDTYISSFIVGVYNAIALFITGRLPDNHEVPQISFVCRPDSHFALCIEKLPSLPPDIW